MACRRVLEEFKFGTTLVITILDGVERKPIKKRRH
jgi:hypothetical protein